MIAGTVYKLTRVLRTDRFELVYVSPRPHHRPGDSVVRIRADKSMSFYLTSDAMLGNCIVVLTDIFHEETL